MPPEQSTARRHPVPGYINNKKRIQDRRTGSKVRSRGSIAWSTRSDIASTSSPRWNAVKAALDAVAINPFRRPACSVSSSPDAGAPQGRRGEGEPSLAPPSADSLAGLTVCVLRDREGPVAVLHDVLACSAPGAGFLLSAAVETLGCPRKRSPVPSVKTRTRVASSRWSSALRLVLVFLPPWLWLGPCSARERRWATPSSLNSPRQISSPSWVSCC